jgi:hypothetical protein
MLVLAGGRDGAGRCCVWLSEFTPLAPRAALMESKKFENFSFISQTVQRNKKEIICRFRTTSLALVQIGGR